ncbi:MAG: TlpA family protein disulfide reductase, partial [Actinobacteria bacterium]|nr:TlpA family protein disulfide reductase [Actinomycetota bacterium]
MASENTTVSWYQDSLWRKRAAIGVGVALVLGLTNLLSKPAPEGPRNEDTGRVAAPEFSLPLLAGSGELASSELEGKPLVINFWGSWCKPCEEELPTFQQTYVDYQDEVEFVGINMRDDPDDARAMAE